MGFLKLESLESTVFFVQERDLLKHMVELTILNKGKDADADLEVEIKSETYITKIGRVSRGTRKYKVLIPDIRQPTRVKFKIYADGELQDEASVLWKPKRHWLVYVVQESHHDLGYTDLPQHVLREQNDFLDKVLDLCEETSNWPYESRFRYTIEQSWSILNYIENRPRDIVDRLMELIREGRIEVLALYGNEISDMCGHEELIRLLYPAFQLKRKYKIPIKCAEIADVPGLSWALPAVLSGSGVRYFVAALPRGYYRGGREKQMDVHPFWDESKIVPGGVPRAFYWLGPDGSRVLFWYGPGYGISDTSFLSSYHTAYKILPEMLTEFEEKGYPFDAVRFRVQGAHRDNSPPSIKFSNVAKEWNSKWAYPKIIIATNSDFFEYIEEKSRGNLPVYRGELPNTDYTIGAASTAYETGINRIAHDLLLSAEKFSTIAAVITDYPYPYEVLTEAYNHALLFDEHTWGMMHPIGPAQDACWNEKALHAYKSASLAQDVLLKSLNKIVDQINLPKDGYYIVVFNPLSWRRTDVVHAYLREPDPCGHPIHPLHEVPEERKNREEPPILVQGTALGRNIIYPPLSLIAEPFDLIDEATNQRVPYQLIEVSSPRDPTPLAAYRYALAGIDPRNKKAIVFVAEDVPPLGYKIYRILPSEKKTAFSTSLIVTDESLENQFYKIVIDPKTGTIKSIYDKELGRELVDKNAPHGFNQYIARSSCTGEEHSAERIIVRKGKEGPVLASIIIEGEGVGCPQITQEITIYDKIKRIDIANRLLKDSTPFLEIYFAYPFNVDNPKVKFEATGSVVTPLKDQFPGSCTDYYAVQHWVNVSGGDFSITFSSIEAHMVEIGGLWPGYVSQAHHCITPPGYGHEFLKPGDLKKGYIYSYVMNNNFRTNFQPTQVGDILFRYSITTHMGDWKEGKARDFGWGISNPLIPVFIKGRKEGRLPKSKSFCSLDRTNVMLLTLKMAEDKEGIIIRLIETEGTDAAVTVTLPFVNIKKAYLTNLMEENKKLLSTQRNKVTVPIKAFGISTIRIKY